MKHPFVRFWASAASRCRLPFVSALFLFALYSSNQLQGQSIDRITTYVNPAKVVALPNHHPQWANPDNLMGPLSADLPLEHLTLVLSRSPQQEQELENLLAEQQNLSSPEYHHWLTPAQMGERFGLSDHDIASLSDWLRSQGLHVNWVSPGRTFIGFGGTAGTVGRAFHTEFHTYKAESAPGDSGDDIARLSVASDPSIPAALMPAIKAIHGLYTIENHPLHSARLAHSVGPRVTASNGEHFISPEDFAYIYDAPGQPYSSGQTIGIVGESRTNFSDFASFRLQTGTQFNNPTEIIPTAYGGVDPGPAYTTPPTTKVSLGVQSEATLDVDQAASLADGAQVLLVVATAASGGVEADAQYLVQTSPVPAQIMSISFGACESSAGPSAVAFWDTLFKQAAAEGISVLVSSGDSGASGCDASFATPPAAPAGNSPNYICSSSYVTCVGGTQFNDTTNPSQYWSANNNGTLHSAFGYIPEGGWNEPLNANNAPQVAASGGGVSRVIATPTWQTGTGVPSARTGRYTPDVAFSASEHDGYFGCFAAAGASCVAGSDGSFSFVAFAGTSAAAPAMAAIAALIDAGLGAPQGNLGPQLYQLAATTPSVFHDVTVASSGVTSCSLNTPSMCNNSSAGPTSQTGGHAGYLVTTGYDEVTGLGSINIVNLLENYPKPPTLLTDPASLTFYSVVGFPTLATVQIKNSGSTALDSVTSTITGANASDFVAANNCPPTLAANTTCSLQITFTPSAAGTHTATMTVTASNASNGSQVVSLTGAGSTTLYTPFVTVTPSSVAVYTSDSVTVTVTVTAPSSVPITPTGPIQPTGSVTLTSGSYASSATALGPNGTATILVPAGSLADGSDVLTATYTPDSTASAVYNSQTGIAGITVTAGSAPPPPPPQTPGFTVTGGTVTVTQGQSLNNTTLITLGRTGGFTGSIALTAVITSSPPNAQDMPTLSFGNTSPVNVTGDVAYYATLTVNTTMPGSNVVHAPESLLSWWATGGASLGWLFFLCMPNRLRRYRSMLGMALLLTTFAGGTLACGGSSGSTGSTSAPSNPGTSAGQYTATITGTSGAIKATGTVTIVVQ